MVSILIKSFNRPYYLDRCLNSIQKFVSGDYKVIVLDDGTPEKYLSRISELYPYVEIKKSNQHEEKGKAIAENLLTKKEIDGFQVPIGFWKEEVKKAGKYVMVTEDDVWFTREIDLNFYAGQMGLHGTDLLKLGWLGESESNQIGDEQQLTDEILLENLQDLFVSNEFVMDLLLHNKYKFFSLLYRLGMVDHQTTRKYWKLNTILMGLWNKEYWLYVWKNLESRVNEKQQLRNAAVWLNRNKKNSNLIGKTKKNYLKTTFQSSATNSYHKYGNDFDVNYFNHKMNEAWLESRFDSMENFPKDFSLEYFELFFDEQMNKSSFREWVEKFKSQYRNIGFQTE